MSGERHLRVCMLTTRFYPDHGGGALQALRLCQKLGERGVDTFVITGHRHQAVVRHMVQGVSVTRLPLPRREGPGVLPFYARLLRLLLACRHDYDLIHAHAVHHHAYAGFLAGRLLGKPAIAKVTGLGADTPARIRRRRLGGIQVRLLRLASCLVVTSQELYDQVGEGGAFKVERIPNGVDTHRFHPVGVARRAALRKAVGVPEEALVVVFVGAIRPVKGVDVLASAWARLTASMPSLHLLLVGPYRQEEHWGVDAEYVRRVEALLRTGGTSARQVSFVGQVPDVRRYLQAADLFVLPSRSEGMPNALLEAMACGLPFVATRLGCVEEMAPPEQHPYLVPVDDVDALAEAVLSLARDADARRRLSTAVRRTVEARYSLDVVADRYVDLYRRLLEERG